jgi:Zn-dependent protease
VKALLLLFKSKAAITALSMIISVGAYALLWGWPYAVGFVLLIFIHEMGHFVAARQRGLDVGAPTFIPFVGAWIQLKDLPHDVETEAYVGLAGPLAGSAAALACFEVARWQGSGLMLALAYSGFMLNLFNLVPVSPFDGGRVTAVISPRLWLVGAPLLVGLFLWNPSPIFLLFAVMAAPQVMLAIKGNFDTDYYRNVSPQTRFNYGAAYLGLVAYLGAMTYSLHNELEQLRQHL